MMLPIPNGWFAVARSSEVDVVGVLSAHYFGRDLVVFRTESGTAGVFDAHCPHLGAHLGVGGKVVGEALQCPFHGWRFATDGTCREIDYAKRIPQGAKASAYPVSERNGYVFVWWHSEGAEPWYEIPEWPESSSAEWSTPDLYEWEIGANLQEVGENGVDAAHFHYVHGTQNVPVTRVDEDGVKRTSLSEISMKTPRGSMEGAIESTVVGPGFAVTRFTGICETLELAASTPIDANRCQVRYAFLQPKVDGEDPKGGVAAAIIRDIVKQTNEDIPIWENKIHQSQPMLCDGDGPIAEYRRWYRQFHPGGTEASPETQSR